jgi:hypothetical protein
MNKNTKMTKREAGALGNKKSLPIILENKRLRIEKYYANPMICTNSECDNIIPYDKHKTNKFCSSRCYALSNNSQTGTIWVVNESSSAIKIQKSEYGKYREKGYVRGRKYNNNVSIKGEYIWKCASCDKTEEYITKCATKHKKYCNSKCKADFHFNKRVNDWLSGKVELKCRYRTPFWVKRYLIEILGNKCSCCGIAEWLGKEIIFDVDHIDGNYKNNELENLRLLCQNCHSQTITYKGKNKGNGRDYRRERWKEGKTV